MLKPLSELLEDKTVLVFGAGASMEYGFPSWEGLKVSLLEVFSDTRWQILSASEGGKWWKDTIENMESDETIDTVAMNAPGEYFDLFRIAMAVAITRYECKDKENENTGWVERFAEKYLEIIAGYFPDPDSVRACGSNLSVITLNYDRSFDIRFYSIVLEKFRHMLEKPRDYEKKYNGVFSAFSRVLHVHGAVGSTPEKGGGAIHHTYLNPGTGLQVPYGDTGRLHTMVQHGQIPFIAPVDDLRDAVNPTYDSANELLAKARFVLCIGLSPLGVTESQLDFSNAESVFYSGKEKVYDNFVPLGLRASPLIEQL